MGRYLVVFLIFIGVISCSDNNVSNEAVETEWMEYHFDFEQEIHRLKKHNPKVEKTTVINGKEETKIVEVDWEQELLFFKEAAINKPIYRDSYELIKNGKIIQYKAKTNKLPIQLYELVVDEKGDIAQVSMLKRTKDELSYFNQDLVYKPGEVYSISGIQGMEHSRESTYLVIGKIMN